MVLAGQFPDQTGADVMARRWRRARSWLAFTVALHLGMLSITLVLLPLGRIEQTGSLVFVIVVAVGPVAWGLWLERRRPSAGRPAQWPWRSLLVAFVQVIALGYAVNGVLARDVLAPWQRLPLILAIPLIPAMTALLARRALLHPLVPELGRSDVEVIVEIRTARRPWYYSDTVKLTGRTIEIAVRSGSGRATRNPRIVRIALADVTAAGARPAQPQDSPWITLADCRGLSLPPGDMVVLRHGDAIQVLPVADAAVFAELVRIRAGRVRGTSIAAPGDTTAPAETVRTVPVSAPVTAPAATASPSGGHVPEVLPAPEPAGPQAHPVAGPADPPRAGPGMTVRRALGYPLALLGIVGVPVGSLGFAGLLTPVTDLAQDRLVFALLWTAAAAAIWLRSWQQPRYWPFWALMAGLGTGIVGTFEGSGSGALLTPVAAVLLTVAGRQVLLRPIATDLAASRLEIPLRGVNFTFLVQHDRLLIKLRESRGGAVGQALPLGELAFAQPGRFTGNEAHRWPFPGSRWSRMGTHPVLRLVAGCQQWLVPVPQPRELAAIIQARAATASRPAGPPVSTREQWHELQSWAAQQLTAQRRFGGLTRRTVGFRLVVAVPVAFLGSALLTEVIARQAWDSGVPVVAAVTLVIATLLVADWFRVRRRLRTAEDNTLPPGSPPWGELRPGYAPLPGWQPWWDGS